VVFCLQRPCNAMERLPLMPWGCGTASCSAILILMGVGLLELTISLLRVWILGVVLLLWYLGVMVACPG
jgi:hypothetical protein